MSLTESGVVVRHPMAICEPVVTETLTIADAKACQRVEDGLRHQLVVLHEDADFQTVARIVPELRQGRINA